MKNLLLLFIFILSAQIVNSQTSYQKGIIRGNFTDNTQLDLMEFDNINQHVLAGRFYDSVQVSPFFGSQTLYGGSIASSVHNAFFAVYDEFGSVMFAHKFGNATDSVTITSATFDNSSNLILAGTFKGTVDFADNATTPFYLTSTGAGSDGFLVYFDYTGAFINAVMFESNGSRAIVNDVTFNAVGDILAVGNFTGTIDMDPSAADTLFTATGTDGFIVTLNSGLGYISSAIFDGVGNQIPTHVTSDWTYPIVGGLFNGQIDLDLSGGNAITPSNGANDVFIAYMDNAYVVSDSIIIGGPGYEQIKDMMFSLTYSYQVLMEFEQTVDFDPNGGGSILTSNGQSDVAVVRYGFNGMSFGSVSQFGNSNDDVAYRIVKNNAGGGRSSNPDDDYIVTLGFSSSYDFDPNTSNVVFGNSSNTTMNSAIINLDSAGNYMNHGIIEGKSILGYKGIGFSGNDIIMAGNFNGSLVDILPYADTSTLTHSGANAIFYEKHNRCQITMDAPYIVEPYECFTCNAKLAPGSVYGAIGSLSYFWSNGDYISYDEVATVVCPDNSFFYSLNVTDYYGCSVNDTIWVHHHDSIAALDVTLNLTATSCGNNLGIADGTPINNLGTASFYWSNGSTAFSADSLVAGNYFVHMTDDSLKCYVAKTFFIDNSDGPVITVNSSTEPACGGVNDGSIDVSVSGGAAPYTFLWSNGETTEDLTGLAGGNYTLIVTDAAGCENTVCLTLYQPNEMYGYLSSGLANCGFADGYIVVEVYGGNDPYTFQWDAAAGSSTNDTVLNLPSGLYNVTVTDSIGCSKNFGYGISDWGGPWAYTNWTSNPDCIGTSGFIDIYSWTPGLGMTYQWATGENTEDISVTTGGTYNVIITDDWFCKTHVSAWVMQVPPMEPTICMVTVDSTSTQNVVVWDKSTTQEAEYYNIYREGYCDNNNFGIVGTVDFDSLSVFYDTVVNSDTRTWRYYVTAVDTCGVESGASAIHRTIHLTAAFCPDTTLGLEWSEYQGMPILGYKIYRENPAQTGYDFVDSVGPLTTNYIDAINFAPYTEVEYFIDAIPASPCVATRAYNQNEARSNHSRAGVPPPDTTSTVDLPEVVIENSFQLYPNPSNEVVYLNINGEKTNWKLEMLDQIGRVVMSGNVRDRATLPVKNINAGVYFIRLTSETNEIHIMKLMVIH